MYPLALFLFAALTTTGQIGLRTGILQISQFNQTKPESSDVAARDSRVNFHPTSRRKASYKRRYSRAGYRPYSRRSYYRTGRSSFSNRYRGYRGAPFRYYGYRAPAYRYYDSLSGYRYYDNYDAPLVSGYYYGAPYLYQSSPYYYNSPLYNIYPYSAYYPSGDYYYSPVLNYSVGW